MLRMKKNTVTAIIQAKLISNNIAGLKPRIGSSVPRNNSSGNVYHMS